MDFFTPYGARIEGRTLEWPHSKINQPFEQELVLQIRGNRKTKNSCYSAHSVFGRIQRTQTNFENPAFPNTFIMVMRKYLQGAVIEGIEQMENDRFSRNSCLQ